MTTHLLARTRHRPGPVVTLAGDISLSPGRAHEACGPARHGFALWLAGQMQGPVLWISAGREAGQLNPDGMRPFADPGRFLFVTAPRDEDILWCAEEALRAGAAALVVADLPEAPALTPVRRLHLAAEAGAACRMDAPTCLLLTPGAGGAQGIESRWHMAPAHTARSTGWRLERRRARALPPCAWHVARGQDGMVLSPVAVSD